MLTLADGLAKWAIFSLLQRVCHARLLLAPILDFTGRRVQNWVPRMMQHVKYATLRYQSMATGSQVRLQHLVHGCATAVLKQMEHHVSRV